MTLSSLISRYRESHGLSQRQFATLCGLSNGSVSLIESGLNPATGKPIKPSLKTLQCIAAGMSMSLHDLLSTSDDLTIDLADTSESAAFADLGFLPPPTTTKKPRLGRISCGKPIDSEENFDGYDDVPDNIQCDFTLICEGDSMIGARIQDGDVVYIRQQPDVESGQIAAVLIDGTEKLLKRVLLKPNRIILQAENRAYEPLIFDGEEMNRVSIIGRAVGFTSVIR